MSFLVLCILPPPMFSLFQLRAQYASGLRDGAELSSLMKVMFSLMPKQPPSSMLKPVLAVGQPTRTLPLPRMIHGGCDHRAGQSVYVWLIYRLQLAIIQFWYYMGRSELLMHIICSGMCATFALNGDSHQQARTEMQEVLEFVWRHICCVSTQNRESKVGRGGRKFGAHLSELTYSCSRTSLRSPGGLLCWSFS